MLETRKVDNNNIHKALFVSLRPLYATVMRYLKECSKTVRLITVNVISYLSF